jgi:hypothetical protein
LTGRLVAGARKRRRQELESWIEDAIALLGQMDGDPDFEPHASLSTTTLTADEPAAGASA